MSDHERAELTPPPLDPDPRFIMKRYLGGVSSFNRADIFCLMEIIGALRAAIARHSSQPDRDDRLRKLARRSAVAAHEIACVLPEADRGGHVWRLLHEGGFEFCAHADCSIFREDHAPLSQPEQGEKDFDAELALRQEWWFGHGCSSAILYGDDGEMQCNATAVHRPLDFKREPLSALATEVYRVRQNRLISPPAPVTPPATDSGWQPIETLSKETEFFIGAWPHQRGPEVGEVIQENDGVFLCAATGNEVEPSHWMPLPAPPSVGSSPQTETNQP